MYVTSSSRQQQVVSTRPLPSTPTALAAELAALLGAIGVRAIVTDARGTPIAASADAERELAWRGGQLANAQEVRLCGQTLRLVLPQGPARPTPLDITPRQRVIVEMIAKGMRNREIAAHLGISLHTVRRHVEAMLKRLGVSTRAAAAVMLREAKRWEQGQARPARVA